jgi:mannose-6-phosphate isomerase-like protein (cupin superfamily)
MEDLTMPKTLSGIVVVKGGRLPVAPYRTELHHTLQGDVEALRHEQPRPITAADLAEGLKIEDNHFEGIGAVVVTVAPGGGESEHHHPSYMDTILYVVHGSAEIEWRDGDLHRRENFGAGDFVFIAPSLRHHWRNTGQSELRMIAFFHAHNPAS